MNVTTASLKLKQPPVFKLAYATTICERIGFYVISYLLVMYIQHIFGFTDAKAFTLFGVFTALAFLTPALGGYLGDNIIGIRRCIILGLFFEGTGLLLLMIHGFIALSIALSFIIIGVGFFKTSPTDLLAQSYDNENDPRIDTGFTYYYMSINIGSLISAIVASFVQRYFGWNMAFLTGGLLLYIGLFLYYFFRKTAHGVDTNAGSRPLSFKKILLIVIGIIASVLLFSLLVLHVELSNIFFAISTTILFLYFLYEIIKSPTKEDKWDIIVCIYLIIIGLACAVLYFQMFTSLELFIQRAVNRVYFGYEIPTVMYLSLESAFVVILGPVLAAIYDFLNKRNKDMSVVTKLTWGLLATSVSFFFLVLGAHFPDSAWQTSSLWIVIMLFIFTIGDLMNSALGVAMVTRIAPKRMYGVMMGAWFLVGNALAASLSGEFAGVANIPQHLQNKAEILHIYSAAFFKIGMAGVIFSIIAFAINPFVKRVIHRKN